MHDGGPRRRPTRFSIPSPPQAKAGVSSAFPRIPISCLAPHRPIKERTGFGLPAGHQEGPPAAKPGARSRWSLCADRGPAAGQPSGCGRNVWKARSWWSKPPRISPRSRPIPSSWEIRCATAACSSVARPSSSSFAGGSIPLRREAFSSSAGSAGAARRRSSSRSSTAAWDPSTFRCWSTCSRWPSAARPTSWRTSPETSWKRWDPTVGSSRRPISGARRGPARSSYGSWRPSRPHFPAGPSCCSSTNTSCSAPRSRPAP